MWNKLCRVFFILQLPYCGGYFWICPCHQNVVVLRSIMIIHVKHWQCFSTLWCILSHRHQRAVLALKMATLSNNDFFLLLQVWCRCVNFKQRLLESKTRVLNITFMYKKQVQTGQITIDDWWCKHHICSVSSPSISVSQSQLFGLCLKFSQRAYDFLHVCACPLQCCLQSVSRLFSLRSVKKRCVWWVGFWSLPPADALK